MKNILILLCFCLAGLSNGHAFGQVMGLPAEFGPHRWTAKVKVADEDGSPFVGANVSISYDVPPAGPDQPRYAEVKGITDANGMFSASHTDSSLGLAITVEKSGYYATHTGHQFYYDEKNRHPNFTLQLKKIGKPIAMYAKHLNTHVPALDNPVGFDFMAGDWVAPYGKGANTDILFSGHFDKHADGESDFTLTVSFPKVGDGIQEFTLPDAEKGSGLRSPHEAPLDGYQSQWVQTDNRKPGKPVETNRDQNRNYFFRVRTALDSNGNVQSAIYGKIYGDFMEFSYYLNPTPNSRNMEFDPSQNLVTNLPFDEQVRQP